MSEVTRYVTTCDCMSEAAWDDYVRHDDYAALEDELAKSESRLHEVAVVCATAEQERNAALKQVEGFREALEKIAAIKNRYNCGDWDEIEEAREIAGTALSAKP